MAFARYQSTAVDTHGDVLGGATVTVRNEATGALAAIKSDRAGSTPQSNPFNADTDGSFFFHVAGGAYRIDVSLGAFTKTYRYQPVGTGAEADDPVLRAMLAANVEVFLGAPSSANLRDALTDETGSGAAVFATSPTIATPAISSPTVAGILDLTGASGGQIKFPGTQNPSSNANTLDDYEEGSWTPGITFGGGSTGITYSSRTGIYVKIGKWVWFEGLVQLSSKGSSTGSAHVTGLPFTENGGINSVPANVFYDSNFSSLSGNLLSTISSGGTDIELRTSSATGFSDITNSNFSNTSFMRFAGYYQTS